MGSRLIPNRAYSLEPLRFKRRGFLNLVTLSLYSVLLAYTVHLLRDGATDEDTPLARPIRVQYSMIGLLLVNQIEDYHEDKQMNVLTSIVRLGLKKASMVSLLFTAVMCVVLLVVFSILARTPYALLGVALMLVAYAATLRYHFKLFEAATSGRPHTRRQPLNGYGSWPLRFHCGSLYQGCRWCCTG